MHRTPATTRRTLLRWALPLGAAGIAPQAFAADALPAEIRIGVASPSYGDPPRLSAGSTLAVTNYRQYVEKEFAKDGVKVRWIFFKGAGPAVNEAFSSGQLDFATQGDVPAIIGRASGARTRAVAVLGTRSNFYVVTPPDSPIRSVADLKGKRVAVWKGTMSHLPFIQLLALNGLSERDVKTINLDSPTGQAAITTRDIDALVGGIETFKLRDAGIARIAASSRKSPTSTSQAVFVVNEPFAEKYPGVTQRVVNSIVSAAHWASQEANRKEVFDIWSTGGRPLAVWEEEFAGGPLSPRLSPQFDPFSVQGLRTAVKNAHEYKLIRRPFDVDQWVESQYVQRAIATLGIQGTWPDYGIDGEPQPARKGL